MSFSAPPVSTRTSRWARSENALSGAAVRTHRPPYDRLPFHGSAVLRENHLRVLHVIPSIGPLRGGPSFVIRAMSEGLAAQGCEIDVVTTDDNGPEQRLAVVLGRPVRENHVTYWYFRRQMRFYTVSWPLSRWLGRHVADYDLVHIHALFSLRWPPPRTGPAITASPTWSAPWGL